MLDELPKELREMIEKLGGGTVIKVSSSKNDKKHFVEELGEMLGAFEGLKYVLAEEIPHNIYNIWLRLVTHYASASGMFLKAILISDKKALKEADDLRKSLNQRIKNFLNEANEKFQKHKDCKDECKHDDK